MYNARVPAVVTIDMNTLFAQVSSFNTSGTESILKFLTTTTNIDKYAVWFAFINLYCARTCGSCRVTYTHSAGPARKKHGCDCVACGAFDSANYTNSIRKFIVVAPRPITHAMAVTCIFKQDFTLVADYITTERTNWVILWYAKKRGTHITMFH